MSKTSDMLMQMYQAMRARFGHQNWWGADTELEMCVGAILTQNTNWGNVKMALANLKATDALSISALATMPAPKLAELIKPAGYFNIKAKRLKNFVTHVHKDWGDDLRGFLDRPAGALREDLLSVNGIGRETADSMVLYAARKCTFVVDTYTYRILLRHHLIAREDDYETIKELMESSLPCELDLYNDYHAQLVAIGKNYCRPTAQCDECPLNVFPHDPNAGREDV